LKDEGSGENPQTLRGQLLLRKELERDAPPYLLWQKEVSPEGDGGFSPVAFVL